MSRITVLRTLRSGESDTSELDELEDLRQAAASWSWSDLAATDPLGGNPRQTTVEVRSEVFGDGDLVGALPLDLGDVVQDDASYDELELPLGDDGRTFAPVTVNGYRWALVNQPVSAWVPVPFWEYPGLEMIYELSTSTVDGAEWGDRLYQVPGLIVRLTIESHFDSMTGGIEELALEAGTADHDFGACLIPDPYVLHDRFQSVDVTVPGLDAAGAQALVDELKGRCAPGAFVQVNAISVQTDEDGGDVVPHEGYAPGDPAGPVGREP